MLCCFEMQIQNIIITISLTDMAQTNIKHFNLLYCDVTKTNARTLFKTEVTGYTGGLGFKVLTFF